MGFRPAVYRLAKQLGLSGFVFNNTKGVTIELQGKQGEIDDFIEQLKGEGKPPLAKIKTCEIHDIQTLKDEREFVIRRSKSQGTALSEVSADVAVCGDCLAEIRDAKDFRYRYPFINCTNCGPRYSIVKTIPYDRPNTTMSVFSMCKRCEEQYEDVGDRRFHAQPVACPACGPKIWLTDNQGKTVETNGDKVITETARLLREGKILAIKGVGGFHLVADALNDEAVRRLRQRKRRDHKPFAVMADCVETIRRYAIVDTLAEQILTSPESPIVLMPKKQGAAIASAVAEAVGTLGFMLCYAPLHYMLFAEGLKVLVMTSGNMSDEPLICKNETAIAKLGDVADAFLTHDRDIFRQVDDSIVHFVDGQPAMLRRSRGYVPTPLLTDISCNEDIFAAGADLKNTFCFVKGNQIICSEHIGDLEDAEVYHHYVSSVEHLRELFEVEPSVVACDLHPSYLSSQYARTWHGLPAREGTAKMAVPLINIVEVQHHWAHIASVMVEHGVDEPVIGLACDGTGYGTDGAIWGCECLIADLQKFERFGHLAYYPLAGADAASKEPIRPAVALLMQAYGGEFNLKKLQWLIEKIEPEQSKQKIVCEQIRKEINTVPTSSLGRVFDAVSAMLGLGNYNHFEAQLPMALEALAEANIEDCYEFGLAGDPVVEIDLREMIRQLTGDIKAGTASGVISAKFHNTIAAALAATATAARDKTRIETVAISGGVFCNRLLANRLISLLKKDGFSVLFNRDFPANDGGISVGQAAIAAKLVNQSA